MKTERTISFDTDEGSNMDVAISPDERTVLFTLLGDLYTVPAAGGKAAQLTRGMSLKTLPAWSPDGDKVAYLSDQTGSLQLHVMSKDGDGDRAYPMENAQLNNLVNDFFWSDDGMAITVKGGLFHGRGLSNSVIVYLSGGTITVDKRQTNILGFSNHDRYAYYLEESKTSKSIRQYDGQRKSERIVLEGSETLRNIRVSPNGEWLTFIKSDTLFKKNLGSDQVQPLLKLEFRADFGANNYSPKYAFSSDSKSIYIAYGGKLRKVAVSTGGVLTIPFHAHVKVDSTLYQSYAANDLRKSIFFRIVNNRPFIKRGYSAMFAAFTGLATDELYLTWAECYARSGQLGAALADLNLLLRNRFETGSFTDITAASTQEALAIILAERLKELVWRGLRWLDLRRLNLEGYNITPTRNINGTIYTLLPKSTLYAYPIPPDEIRVSGIEQNHR